MTWGYGKPIECEVNEIEPEGNDLLFQNQYRLNLDTEQYDLHKVPSPPLGIMLLSVGFWQKWWDDYLNDLLQSDFEGFPETCFRGRECMVQRDLLYPIHAYYTKSSEDVSQPCQIRACFTDNGFAAFALVVSEVDRGYTHHDTFPYLD